MSTEQSPPSYPRGHSSHPVVELHIVSAVLQLHSFKHSAPHCPAGHAADKNIMSEMSNAMQVAVLSYGLLGGELAHHSKINLHAWILCVKIWTLDFN